MPVQRKWNKFAVASLVVVIVNFLLVSRLLGVFQNSSSNLIFLTILPLVVPLIGLGLAIQALRTIDSTRERGKVLSVILIVLISLTVIVYAATMYFGSKVIEMNSGRNFIESQRYEEAQRDPVGAATIDRDYKKLSDMVRIRGLLNSYFQTHQQYPANLELLGPGDSIPDYSKYTYLQLSSGGGYVLRVQLEADYRKDLNSQYDQDGIQGSLDCDDKSLYLCFTDTGSQTTIDQTGYRKVILYHYTGTPAAEYQTTEQRVLSVPQIADATLKLLFARYLPALKSEYIGVSLANSVATVNFKQGARTYLYQEAPGVSAEYENSIRKTLLQFNTITKVQFAIDGQVITNWDA